MLKVKLYKCHVCGETSSVATGLLVLQERKDPLYNFGDDYWDSRIESSRVAKRDSVEMGAKRRIEKAEEK